MAAATVDTPLCKGDWRLGTTCGKCQRCLESAPAEIARLKQEVRCVEAELGMYQRAWQRELKYQLVPKRHLIDALVLTTRKIQEELFAFKEKERVAKLNAELAVRDECEASWRQAAEEFENAND